jgi:hypothetical protein
MKNTKQILGLGLLWISFGCGPKESLHSQLNESPNEYNRIQALGLSGTFTWSDINSIQKYSLPELPWTDTYWPTVEKGLAIRFQNSKPAGLAAFDFSNYLSEFFEVLDSRDPQKIASLSPAEKHDLLLTENLDDFGSLTRAELLSKARTIQKDLEATVQQIAQSQSNEDAKSKEMIAAIKSAANSINGIARDRQIFPKLPMLSSSWGDWSYKVSNPRNQIHSDSEFEINGVNLFDSESVDWSWEGICHGWAPASLFTKEPKHAVMAQRADGTSVLFTEGDLRGLLSKAWADQAPRQGQTMIGGRCEAKDKELKSDRYGRILDGVISCASAGCESFDKSAISFTKSFRLQNFSVQGFREWGKNGSERFMVIVDRNLRNQTIEARLFTTAAALKNWVKTQDSRIGVDAIVNTQTNCRDVNPMTLHLLLTKVMPKGQGFIMDRIRSMEVWNQPVQSFEIEYVPVPGSTVAANELTEVSTILDDHWQHRAPDTTYVVNVTAKLHWSKENGPRVSYTEFGRDIDADSMEYLNFKYTLEFDAQKNLIGGEWGHVPGPGQEWTTSSRNGSAPDFVYYYENGAEPLNRNRNSRSFPNVDYDNLVKKLHACSLKDDDLKDFRLSSGTTIQYVECKI